jgi:lysyl-tRNA synthetase class 2
MDLLDDLTQTLLGTPPARRTTHTAAFQHYVGLSPHTATPTDLAAAATPRGISVPDGMDAADRDEWLNLLLATLVEPQLGRDRPEILYHYPATQAALAQVVPTEAGHEVAERFELYYRGVELANGYHELADAAELRERFTAVTAARIADGRAALPMPERLLAALQHGQPDCTGVALGFDRLAMLAIGATSIDEVIAFPQDRA